MSSQVYMGLRPTRGDESRCHPERSEGSAGAVRCELMQMLRFAQYDSAILSRLLRVEGRDLIAEGLYGR